GGGGVLGGREEAGVFLTAYSLGRLGLREGNWKFIWEVGAGRSKLYDLGVAPGEKQSVAERPPERVERYRQYLLRWAAAQRGLVAGGGEDAKARPAPPPRRPPPPPPPPRGADQRRPDR